jgi:exo-1,4-beta-D-glucosaminidase
VQYSYDDRSIVVVNSFYQPFANMKVVAAVYNLDMSVKFSREMKMDAEPDSSTRVFKLPEIEGLSNTWFLSLKLEDPSDDMVSENFYWLSTTPETLEWDKGTWYTTPTKTFANYIALESLPPVTLKVTSKSGDGTSTVSVSNPTKSLAFAVHLKVTNDIDGEEILPVLWEDNYFSLPPGESRQITATYAPLAKGKPVVEVSGWNVK